MNNRRKNIIFIGFTASGKSRIGKLIAEKLSYRFVDLDRAVETLYQEQGNLHHYCRAIYAAHGQEFFNALEIEALTALKDESNLVISPGGGILQEPQAGSLLKQLGPIIYLSSSPEVVFERLKRRGFPLYLADNPTLENVRLHWEKRKSSYEAICDVRIDNSNLVQEETVQAVMKFITTHFSSGDQ